MLVATLHVFHCRGRVICRSSNTRLRIERGDSVLVFPEGERDARPDAHEHFQNRH